MLTDIVVRVRCIVSIFGIIVACLACVACGTERQDAVPSPSQTTAKAEDGTEFTGAYARRFADTYDNLQTGFARNLIKDGKSARRTSQRWKVKSWIVSAHRLKAKMISLPSI